MYTPSGLLYGPRALWILVACSEIVGTNVSGPDGVVSVAPLMMKVRSRTHGRQTSTVGTSDGTNNIDDTGKTEWTFDLMGMSPTTISETSEVAELNETKENDPKITDDDINQVAVDTRTLQRTPSAHGGAGSVQSAKRPFRTFR